MMGLELQGLNVYEKVMTVLLIIYAFMVNISTSAVSICICLGVLTILLQYYKTGNIPCVNRYIILAVSIYVLTGMISNTINVGGIDGIKMWIGHTYRFFPMFFAIMYIKNTNQVKYVMFAFLGTVFAENITALNQSLHIWGNYTENGGRVIGLTSNPNVLAPMLVMFLIALYIHVNNFVAKVKIKILMIAGIGLSLISLILTMSRGSWLTFIAVLLLGVLMLKRKRKQLFACVFLMIVCIPMFFMAKPNYYHRIETVTDMSMSSNVVRTYIWRDTLVMISEHPMVGVGLEKYSDVFNDEYASEELLSIEKKGVHHPHNNILMVLSEGGIISLIGYVFFYAVMLLLLFRKAMHSHWTNEYAVMGILLIIAIQLTGMVDMNVYNAHIMRLFLFLLGVSFSGSTILDSKM